MTEFELMAKLPEIKGEAKRQMLLDLCEFRSDAADAFWGRRLKRPINGYLPYLCYSRSDAVSDYAADQLERAVDKIILLRNHLTPELNEDVWVALNLCVFKQSSGMIEVLRKIGQHTELFSALKLDFRALRCSQTLPPFLRRQVNLAHAHRCENEFLPLLNDLLICTYVRSGRTFHDDLTALADEFPQTFGTAGFFSAYVTNPENAFAQYGKPQRFAQLLSTFSGLEICGDSCKLYSPLWFYGGRNLVWHKSYELPLPDDQWICWLCRSYCFADEQQRRLVSKLLFECTGRTDLHETLRDYFFHAALEDTSEENLIGLMRCGGFEMTESLLRGVCEMICQGRNHYHALFRIFELLDLKRPEKLRMLNRAHAYIEACDHRESWYAPRNQFLHAVTRYQNGEPWRYD